MDDVKPSAEYLQELKQYFQSENSHRREARQTSQGKTIIYVLKILYIIHNTNAGSISHGDTIALQTFIRNHWLGCYDTCHMYNCPKMQMTGSNWVSCRGEVFRIYRQLGPGTIRVGDIVGIYYVHQRRWLGCPHSICGKYTCPGSPTTAHGFSTDDEWYRCSGEVFRIYSPNKGQGAVIDARDDVVFYQIQSQLWLAQSFGGLTTKNPCLGTSRPPRSDIYDECPSETFNIWKR